MSAMDETELIELEDEIAGESDTHTLKKEDFTFDISVSIKYCCFKKYKTLKIQEKDLVMYKKAFDVFDLDGSGKINFTEVENLIMNISERKPHESETQDVILKYYFFK